MKYPVVIEEGTDSTAWGVIVPDLPGCFSAGDTLDEAMENVEVAAAAWIDATLDAGEPIPKASPLEAIKAMKDHAGWTFAIVNIDADAFDDKTVRINVSIPARVLKRLDAKVKASGEKDRSSYIAHMAMT
ncbi:MAG: type II toxin-antitoxin system HicB family antitoxin [Luteimonas sp.]